MQIDVIIMLLIIITKDIAVLVGIWNEARTHWKNGCALRTVLR